MMDTLTVESCEVCEVVDLDVLETHLGVLCGMCEAEAALEVQGCAPSEAVSGEVGALVECRCANEDCHWGVSECCWSISRHEGGHCLCEPLSGQVVPF